MKVFFTTTMKLYDIGGHHVIVSDNDVVLKNTRYCSVDTRVEMKSPMAAEMAMLNILKALYRADRFIAIDTDGNGIHEISGKTIQ